MMADEEKQDQTEETQDEAVTETPAEAPAEEPAAEEPAAEEPAAEEAPAEEASNDAPDGASDEVAEHADEPAAPDASQPADTGREAEDVGGESAEAPEPVEVLSPKQKRKLNRSTATGPAGPERSLEERLSERADGRRRNAANRSRYRKRQRDRGGESGTGTPPSDRGPGPKKVRQGKVVSTKADKTITVRIEVARRHPTYEKVVRRSATLHAHDATNQAQEGDTVRVVETRPLSRTKRWRLVEIVERAR